MGEWVESAKRTYIYILEIESDTITSTIINNDSPIQLENYYNGYDLASNTSSAGESNYNSYSYPTNSYNFPYSTNSHDYTTNNTYNINYITDNIYDSVTSVNDIPTTSFNSQQQCHYEIHNQYNPNNNQETDQQETYFTKHATPNNTSLDATTEKNYKIFPVCTPTTLRTDIDNYLSDAYYIDTSKVFYSHLICLILKL